MEWTPQQSVAIQQAQAWAKQRGGPQVFKIFGWAGTGKTTIAREIASVFDAGSLFAAFTGKAALVLRKKGCDASTLHSLIYKATQDEDTGEVTYSINHESPLSTARLLVVDEVSMVDTALGQDILGFGCKVLVLGDPFQLPPVGGGGFFTEGAPDVMLTEIRRQTADDPIIRLSMDVREGRGLQLGTYGASAVIKRATMDREQLAAEVLAADQVLCGRNKTRQTFNQRLRQLRGYIGEWPNRGEKLICLRNNRLKGLLNGGMWTVRAAQKAGDNIDMVLDSMDDDQRGVQASTRREFFTGQEATLDWREKRKTDEFTFGGTITVHKSQGSEWDNVVLFDESSCFSEDAPRHLYTGITRAATAIKVLV